MILFDPQGWAVNGKIRVERYAGLQHGKMTTIHGIIVHQTGAATAASTLAQYKRPGSNGAHFLIDKDGAIIQTASILGKVQHVGPLKARCLSEHNCSPVESKMLLKMHVKPAAMHELTKPVPLRYPANKDAIGIEIVGAFGDKRGSDGYLPYEPLTTAQQTSLKWLVAELRQNFGVPLTEVFRHPDVSRKDPHEAESARW